MLKKAFVFTGLSGLSFVSFEFLKIPSYSHFVNETQNDYLDLITRDSLHNFSTFSHNYRSTTKLYELWFSKKLFEEQRDYKQEMAVIRVRFNDKLRLKNSPYLFQNYLYGIIDSQFGYLSALCHDKQPVVTASMKYQMERPFKSDEDLTVVAYVRDMMGRSAFVDGAVIDENNQVIMRIQS